jgi:hypothetical protein
MPEQIILSDQETKDALTYFLTRNKSDVTDHGHLSAAIKMLEKQTAELKKQRKLVLNRQKSKKGFNPKAYPPDLGGKIYDDILGIMNLPSFTPKRKNSACSDAYRYLARMALNQTKPHLIGPKRIEEEKKLAQRLNKIVYHYWERNRLGSVFLNPPPVKKT